MTDQGPTLRQCAHAFLVDALAELEPRAQVNVSPSTFELAFPSVYHFTREFPGWTCWPGGPMGSYRIGRPGW